MYDLIPETLFNCILNTHGLNCFVPLNIQSINGKRYQNSRTPEQKLAFKEKMSKVMSKIMPGIRKRYMETITPKQKKAFAEMMRKGAKRYWKNVSDEDRKIHCAKQSAGLSKVMKARWAREPINTIGTKEDFLARTHKIGKIEENLPRINTYSGVISMSEMESL